MPDTTHASGDVRHVFAHRFVVDTAAGAILADLGPKGAAGLVLEPGDRVDLTGRQKPSEMKVETLKLRGQTFVIAHGKSKKGHGDAKGEAPADPAAALNAVRAKGFAIVGEPLRKPKHFEILGCDKAGAFVEHHVAIDGTLKKHKPIDRTDTKWAEAIRDA